MFGVTRDPCESSVISRRCAVFELGKQQTSICIITSDIMKGEEFLTQ